MESTPRPIRALLRLPLFYKLLIANALIVLAVAVAGSAAAQHRIQADPSASIWSVILPISVAALGLSVMVNAAVVKLALQPLSRLTDAVRQVEQGDYDVRAAASPVADQDMTRLVLTFNDMLDSVSSYRNRLRAVTVRDLNHHEAERRQLSHDLHDGTAQSLAALLLQLKLARKLADDDERNEVLDGISSQLVATIEDLRLLARELRPQILDMLGLSPALEKYAQSLAQRTGIAIDVQVERLSDELDPDVELALYRLVQEALLNVIRHAQAQRAKLIVERGPNSVVAMVTDDGRGFDPDVAIRDDSTVGLFGMRERAAHAGGSLTVASSPGAGTTVRLEFPVRGSLRYA